jgi:hypothetical protein
MPEHGSRNPTCGDMVMCGGKSLSCWHSLVFGSIKFILLIGFFEQQIVAQT